MCQMWRNAHIEMPVMIEMTRFLGLMATTESLYASCDGSVRKIFLGFCTLPMYGWVSRESRVAPTIMWCDMYKYHG